jgi:DNA-binding SARP family transcriptional activator/TolB-like protein
MIRIQALGGLAVFDGTRPLGGNTQQPRRLAVLAVLARAGDRGVSRDRLAALLWEDADEDRARRSLNQALYALRQDLGAEDAILGTRDLRLNSELIEVDLAAFESARASGALEEAARLYAGPFLGDFHLPGAPAFSRWADEERQALAGEYRGIVEAVAAAASRRDDRSGAVFWWRRLAALDPTDSAATQGLMRALVAAGDVPGALRQMEIFGQLLQQELELPPDPDVIALGERIRREAAERPARPEERPVPRANVEVEPVVVAAAHRPALPRGGTGAVPLSPSVSRLRHMPGMTFTIVALLVAGFALFLASRSARSDARVGQPSRLAVLPFENEGDSNDAYFADGVTDELRGKLASVPGLEVVASSSSSEYRDRRKPLSEVAEELGVTWLLVGKIRWQRDTGGVSRVQVSPELVRITSGAAPVTQWQQPFDAALTDVFQVQADIAAKVAGALDLVLGDSARHLLTARPTQSLAAYDEFLKGEAASQGMKGDQASLRRAIAFYQRATEIDSTYAHAWAQLSRARTALYSNGVPDPALGEQARVAAERARRLGPRDPLPFLAMGDWYGSVNPVDNERALAEYQQGLRLAPDNVDLLGSVVSTETSVGRWSGAITRLARAGELDPRASNVPRRLATVNLFLRNNAAGDSAIDRAIALAPTSVTIASIKIMLAIARGDLGAAQREVRAAATRIDPAILLPFLAYYQDLYWILDDQQQLEVLAAPVSAFDDDRAGWALVRSQLYQLRGDRHRAMVYADSARIALQAQLRAAPDDGQRHGLLGLALAWLGRKEAAEREGLKGVELMPIGRDGYFGPYVQLQLVRIYIALDEQEKAIDQLEPLLQVPFYLSPGWLRIDPTFDPLRTSPRFQALTKETAISAKPHQGGAP